MKIDRQQVDKLMLKRGIVEYKELAHRADISPKHLSAVLCRGTCPPLTAARIAAGLDVHADKITIPDRPAIAYTPPALEEITADRIKRGLPIMEPAPDPSIERIKAQAFATTPDPIWETDPLQIKRTILDFICKPVPEKWMYWGDRERLAFWRRGGHGTGERLVPRDRVCSVEVWNEALDRPVEGIRRKDTQNINAIIAEAPGWEMAENPLRFGPYGKCRGFVKGNVPFLG